MSEKTEEATTKRKQFCSTMEQNNDAKEYCIRMTTKKSASPEKNEGVKTSKSAQNRDNDAKTEKTNDDPMRKKNGAAEDKKNGARKENSKGLTA